MAYIGASLDEVEKTVSTINVACDTMTGNGSIASLVLGASQGVPESVNNISVYFDGVMQRPTTDYTLVYKTVSFVTVPETGVKVTVLSYANEFLDVVSDKTVYGSGIADGAVTTAKQTNLSFGNSNISGTLNAANLTGALPALDGSNVTGLASGQPVVINAADPTTTSNPTNGVGTIWLNSTTGESYCCTDATASDNVWTNIGSGTGSIATPTNPTNAGSFVTPMTESTTYNYIFSGALDNASTPAGTITHYMVDTISNGALTVAAAEVAAGQPHVFTAGAVGSNTAITFRVRAKDNDGHYSSGVTVSMTVQNDAPPGEITNGGAFADMNKSTSYNYTFAGATDDFGVTHYLVDTISNGALTVSAAEVAAGSAHTFNAGAVGSDTAVTFRVRAKDSAGQYSSGVTVSMTVFAAVYTTANGGDTIGTSGNFKYHVFKNSSSFNVTQVGDDSTVEYLVVAGGGGGGFGGARGGAGAGAGGYRTNTGMTVSVQNYTVTVGLGGAGAITDPRYNGLPGGTSSFNNINTSGGGGGGTQSIGTPPAGGSGGGGSGSNTPGAGSGNAGGYSPSEGNNGGAGTSGSGRGGGGGGINSVGATGPASGNGGTGLQNTIGGSTPHPAGNYFAAGGGGGSAGSGSNGTGGSSIGGNGMYGSFNASVCDGKINSGSGGGGASAGSETRAGNGGKGVVIIRYRYQ